MDETTAPILVLGAMEKELCVLFRELEEDTEIQLGAFSFHRGTLRGKTAVLGLTGVGMARAAGAAALALERFRPRAVLNCGTAGGHSPELRPGDIILGETVVNAARVDTPRREAGQGSDCFGWSNPRQDVFTVDGVTYRCVEKGDERLLSLAEALPYSGGRVLRGTILSSDMWNRELDRILYLHRELGSDCEDMESYAVADMAELFHTPFLAVRILSNSEFYPQEGCDYDLHGQRCQQLVLELMEKL